ncbi:MAG: hypothetical protein LBU97_04060 [Alistipes sp.]|jgi:acyl-ACP thioesterase|nr:hypothetical protein [Alistipes sp.]
MAGTYRYRIEPRDVDASLRVRLCAMGDLVLRAAGDDADTLGFGVRDLNTDGASWVLSRMAVEMRRLPSRHEELDVYTWVSDYGRLVTTRNMTVSAAGSDGGAGSGNAGDGSDDAGDGGGQLGAAVTQWAMIDLATRRPLDLSALSDKGTSLVDRRPPIDRPHKVGPFGRNADGEFDFKVQPHRVVYSDIDFNGHVNSMKYLEWMVDTLPPEAIAEMDGFRFDVNYIHEARLGDRLEICCGRDDTGAHLFDIVNAGGLSICKATIARMD